LRIVIGLMFMSHGYPKVFEKKAHNGLAKMLKKLRVPAPQLFAHVVGFVEFFGGLFILIGFMTPVWAFLIAMIMIVAIALTGVEKGFKHGYETNLLVFVVCLMLFMLGGGAFSVGAVMGM